MLVWKVQRVRKPIEHILPFADLLRTVAPIRGACATENHEGCFFSIRPGLIGLARKQAPNEETHPFPAGLLAGQLKEISGLVRREGPRMNQDVTVAHVLVRHEEFLRVRIRRKRQRFNFAKRFATIAKSQLPCQSLVCRERPVPRRKRRAVNLCNA